MKKQARTKVGDGVDTIQGVFAKTRIAFGFGVGGIEFGDERLHELGRSLLSGNQIAESFGKRFGRGFEVQIF